MAHRLDLRVHVYPCVNTDKDLFGVTLSEIQVRSGFFWLIYYFKREFLKLSQLCKAQE